MLTELFGRKRWLDVEQRLRWCKLADFMGNPGSDALICIQRQVSNGKDYALVLGQPDAGLENQLTSGVVNMDTVQHTL